MSKTSKEIQQSFEKSESQLPCPSAIDEMPRSVEELLREIQLYQFQLEIQSEEIRQARLELEASRDRYADFYNFSPVGYSTLDGDAVIKEINRTGTTLLGMQRDMLLHQRFAHFVAPEDRECWHG